MAAENKYIKEISKYNQHGLFKLWKERQIEFRPCNSQLQGRNFILYIR